jgi:hypothetical protein
VRLGGSRFWGGGEGQDGVYLIVGFLVSPVLLLPYGAFLVGICYKSGVWMNLTVCLLRSVRIRKNIKLWGGVGAVWLLCAWSFR